MIFVGSHLALAIGQVPRLYIDWPAFTYVARDNDESDLKTPMQLRERAAADDLTLQGKFWSLRKAAKVFGRLAIVVADRLHNAAGI
jgi:hypothetical protein